MLKVVGLSERPHLIVGDSAIADHRGLIEGFVRSHRLRNSAVTTIAKEEAFLLNWFEAHGPGHRPLFAWEVMDPIKGRQIVVGYGKVLLEGEIQTHTIRAYLGILRRFFAHVLEHPVVTAGEVPIRIQDKYRVTLAQPVSEFDMPRYIYDGERHGVPLDPECLYDFYTVIRKRYLQQRGQLPIRQRNYAMAVLAGESGLRVDELIHLEVEKDLFFESKKLQTRHAKAAKGSGKRSRVTLFTPLARDSLRFYLDKARPHFTKQKTGYLFPSRSGRLLAYSSAQAALKEMVDVAQKSGFPVLDHMTWHWFRRLFATRFVERFPGKIAVLIELLGHMSPNTVHRYVRHSHAWMDNQIKEALEDAERWPSIGS